MRQSEDEVWAAQLLSGDGSDRADAGASAGGGPAVEDSAWAEARARLDARVVDEGAFDVAFEAHESPFGLLLVGATNVGVVRVALPTEDAEGVLAQLATNVSPRVWRAATPTIAATRHQLDEYFEGTRHTFDVPLDWALTAAFRRQVLEATARIPFGETASYGQVAESAGSPKAVRAAGSALATNPLPILVPCHRVLRSDGAVGQYLGGVPMKTALLELEASA